MIRVKPVAAELQELGGILPQKTARRILISAVNDAAKWAETRIGRLIRDTLTLKKSAVDEAITRRTTRDDARGFGQQIRVSRKAVDLREYNPRQTKAGISVKLLKGGKRELIKSAFLAQKLGDNGFKRAGKKRLPIRKLKGPTAIGALLRRDDEVNQIRADAGDRVQARFKSKLDYELSKVVKYL